MRTAKLAAALTALACALLTSVSPASADFGFESFSEKYETSSKAPFYEAGAHANVRTGFELNRETASNGLLVPEGTLKDIEFDLPAGFYADQTVAPTCKVEELVQREGACAVAAQVGTFFVNWFPELGEIQRGITEVPLYRLPTTSEQTAQLGAVVLGVLIKIEVTPRTDGDYGLTAKVNNINQGLDISGNELVLWGVPADPVNDANRFITHNERGAPAGFEPRPFVYLPARCEPMTTTVRADSWQHPGQWQTISSTTPTLTGCDRLSFEPKVSVTPQSSAAGAPSGLNVDLMIPQDNSVGGRSTPQLRKAVVTLPKGVAISPGSASGLGYCSDEQLALGTRAKPSCPNSSKLGTVSVDTPVLEDPLQGNVILGEPRPGNLFRLFLVAEGSGIVLKVPGIAKPDPQTGQITATFDNAPQLPFQTLHLEFKGGPRAPLSLPASCGTYTTHAELTSWSTPEPVASDSSFTIDQNCGNEAKFTPSLEAGTTSSVGGGYSPFLLRVIGQDGQQNLSRIDATLPEGLLAKLAGVPLCGDAVAATGSCPAASQVGATTIGAGAGSNPIYVPEAGKAPTAVYLAGPYKGAPYSLVVKVPAQAGPFALGDVVVRNALNIDPVTTQVTASSDPLPQILQGIPIAYRDVRVEVNRPDFTLNPTGCDQKQVTALIAGSGGASAAPKAPFQAVNCERLAFKPSLALSLSGKTNRSAHPKLKAVLTAPKGDANIARAQVTLPKTEFLENAHIKTVCTRVQYAAGPGGGAQCPKASVYGHAKAWSPLLDKPLEGPVYLRSSSHELPDLVASLDGQIHVDLSGRIDSKNARIRNTFDFVPDAPVSKFVLTMQGGKKGLLVNNTELCKTTPRADIALDAQNGKTVDSSPVVGDDCGKGRKAKK